MGNKYFNFGHKGQNFQSSANQCYGSVYATKLITMACFLKIDEGMAKNDVNKYKAGILQRLHEALLTDFPPKDELNLSDNYAHAWERAKKRPRTTKACVMDIQS